MASDLEANLVGGGISPAAAKIIANAIANAATARTDVGRRLGDATPAQQLRMVDGDTRKYLLGNLDQPRDGAFRLSSRSPNGTYSPRDTSHTYADSQPASANPTLATGTVKEGDYIAANQTATNSVAQSQVGLKVVQKGGVHARLNPATKAVEAVPFLIEPDQEQFIEASIEERADATVLKIRLRNVHQLVLKSLATFSSNAAAISLSKQDNGDGTMGLSIGFTKTSLKNFLDLP